MSSEVSRIMGAYKDALDVSQERYEQLYRERAKSAIAFYNDFFRNLVKQYNATVNDAAGRRQITRIFDKMFGTTDIRFAAIDGTLYRETLEDYMVFFPCYYKRASGSRCKLLFQCLNKLLERCFAFVNKLCHC